VHVDVLRKLNISKSTVQLIYTSLKRSYVDELLHAEDEQSHKIHLLRDHSGDEKICTFPVVSSVLVV